jgi:hypothetical protein
MDLYTFVEVTRFGHVDLTRMPLGWLTSNMLCKRPEHVDCGKVYFIILKPDYKELVYEVPECCFRLFVLEFAQLR